MELTHQELWAKCCRFIQDNITADQYNTWFRDITSVSYADGRLVLMVQSSFFVDQLEERYRGVLRAGICKVYGDNVQLYYRFRTLPSDPTTTVDQKSAGSSPTILAQRKVQPPTRSSSPIPTISILSSIRAILSTTIAPATATRSPAQ